MDQARARDAAGYCRWVLMAMGAALVGAIAALLAAAVGASAEPEARGPVTSAIAAAGRCAVALAA